MRYRDLSQFFKNANYARPFADACTQHVPSYLLKQVAPIDDVWSGNADTDKAWR